MFHNPRNEQENIYVQRINRVLDHVYTHLSDDLSLETVAAIAGFSPFHFHRIFKSMVGETLSELVWRARIERGAMLLRSRPDLPVSDVAAACGFGSLAAFSRAFKKRFGLPPTRWITRGAVPTPVHIRKSPDCSDAFAVTVRQLPAQRLAYIRVADAYSSMDKIERAYDHLLNWYTSRGGDLGQTTLYGMSHDDPDITPREKCRFDWCLSVPPTWEGSENVAVRPFPTCTIASVEMSGDVHLEGRILHYMWSCWLPSSDYQPADLPGMEIYRRFPHETGWWECFDLECAIPLIPF